MDDFEYGTIVNCQGFMNKAVIKYNKMVCISGQFQCLISTVQEDIVAMFAQKHKVLKSKTPSNNRNDDDS